MPRPQTSCAPSRCSWASCGTKRRQPSCMTTTRRSNNDGIMPTRSLRGRILDERDNPARHEARGPDRRAGAGDLGDLDQTAPRGNLDTAPRARRADLIRSRTVADIDDDLDAITLQAAHLASRTSIRYPFFAGTKR